MNSAIRSISSIKVLSVVALAVAVVVSAVASHASVATYRLGLSDNEIVVRNGTTVTVDAKGYYPLKDPALPALPYRVVNVLLPQGHVVGDFRIVSETRATLASGFTPALGVPHVTDDGITGAARPVVGWSEDSRRFPSTPVVHLGTGYLHGYGRRSGPHRLGFSDGSPAGCHAQPHGHDRAGHATAGLHRHGHAYSHAHPPPYPHS